MNLISVISCPLSVVAAVVAGIARLFAWLDRAAVPLPVSDHLAFHGAGVFLQLLFALHIS